MPKGKLILNTKVEPVKIEVAGFFSGVKTGTAIDLGEERHIEITYPTLDSLVKFGRVLETCKGTELDAKKKADAAKAAKTTAK